MTAQEQKTNELQDFLNQDHFYTSTHYHRFIDYCMAESRKKFLLRGREIKFENDIDLVLFLLSEQNLSKIKYMLEGYQFQVQENEDHLIVTLDEIGELDLPIGTLFGMICKGDEIEIRSIANVDMLKLLIDNLDNKTETFINPNIYFE